ncbi:ABC transporter permease [Jiella avicenniae]|uniref:ABC transporter permease n=1 Tax=Jiella avicenniae TaxID=2907202 RepID=A0A9X1NY22_9HYPH|nr:ABC transporter permease [Jiella avicenniae]MCE7027712.1 ABC transporter permease [Jiella avicenniae]MCE7028754.1 ABC transporter permease [Jiella avicenniae]
MGRLSLAAGRIALSLPTIFGVIVISFLLTRALPGDPAAYFAGPTATPESISEIRRSLGLDRSLPVQFVGYLQDLAAGDLGRSISTGQSVLSDLLTRLPASLELTFLALFMSLVVAIPAGILAATRPDGIIDQATRFLVTAGVSLPTFFTGLLLLFIFYFKLGWAPSPLGRLDILYLPPPAVTGFYLVDSLIAGDIETFRASLAQLLLPSITLALFTMAPIARMTRASMIAALGSEYIRTARAAGLSRRTVLFVYALRNALLPVVTTLGMVFSFALGANVLVEKVFAWPGIGSYAVDALISSDYAAVQGFVLTMALLFVTLNLVIDILYTLLDPRIAHET